MTPQQFLTEFGHIASAPNGVQRLREMVLQLAIQGRLVEQRVEDGDVRLEIDEAKAERKAYLTEIGSRSSKADESISLPEMPFAIPLNWCWIALGELARYIQRGKGPKYAEQGQVRVVSQKCVQWAGFDLSPARWIEDRSMDGYGPERFLQPGDLLWNSTGTGTAGRISIYPGFDETAVADSHVTVIRPTGAIASRYLWCLIASPGIQARIDPGHERSIVSGTTNQVELSTSIVRSLPVPLPPLAEQKRIVAKVDELMAICDKLEALQNQRKAARAVLTKEILGRVASDATVDAQTCLQNLSLLVSDVEQIPVLRQTILSLAVQGKLVPQSEVARSVELGDILAEASVNGVSKGPTENSTATEVLKISAGTSRGDFFVDEEDFKHVELTVDEIEKYRLESGDLLACRYNGNLRYVGRFSYYRGISGRCQVNPDKLIRFRIDPQVATPRYVCYMMNAPGTRIGIESMCATTAGNIGLSAGRLKTVTIPLPPFAEQKRIVAKVDDLMALCDTLEAKLRKASQVQEQLAASSVAALTGKAA